jgi:hypothetical protein
MEKVTSMRFWRLSVKAGDLVKYSDLPGAPTPEHVADIMFPALFIWLGTHFHPIFLVGAPVSLLLCIHWLTVPLLWGAWMRLKGEQSDK